MEQGQARAADGSERGERIRAMFESFAASVTPPKPNRAQRRAMSKQQAAEERRARRSQLQVVTGGESVPRTRRGS